MKKLSFFLMAMLISVMGFAADVTMAVGENGSACTVNGTDGIKVGTSKKGGDMTITVPGGATELSFYAAAWKGVTGLSINITPTDNVLTSSIALTDDAGLTNNTPFTLSGNEADYLHTITLQNVEQETTFKLTGSTTKRFVVWGATCTVGSSADFVAAPSIAGDVDFVESTTISITALDGLAIYYTVDGTDPTNESAAYTAPFEVTKTTTVKAIAYNGDNASAIAEKTFKKLQVLTCADAAALCSATETTEKYVVRGYVTELVSGGYSETYKNSSFWMADTKDGGKVLEAYAVDPILESDIQVKVGDYVEVIGKLVLYGSYNTPEVNRGTYTIIPEPAPEPEYMVVEDKITNFVFDMESWPMVCKGGPSADYQVEVYLVLTEDADGTLSYEDCSVSIMGTDATFIDGTLANLDPYAPYADAVLHVQWGEEYYELQLAMSGAVAEPYVVEVENATVEVTEYETGFDGATAHELKVTADWVNEAEELTYAVEVLVTEFDPTAAVADYTASLFVTGDGDAFGMAEGIKVTVAVDGNKLTVSGEGVKAFNGNVYNLSLSGTLPVEEPAGVTYNVTVPEGTYACYIAGGMNNWGHTEMTKVDDTHYTITIEGATTEMKYKYCSGPDWKYVEKDANGNDVQDRTYAENDVVASWAAIYNPNPTVEPETTWTVAGAPAAVFGTEWDPANVANDMTLQNDGTYKWEKKELLFAAGDPIQFKVVKNHAWGEEYPSGNYVLTIAESGIYTLTITFNPATTEVAAVATKTGDAEVEVEISYVLMGVKNDWATGIALTRNEDNTETEEYMLLGQEILEGDAVKVVTLRNGEKSIYCGTVDETSPVAYGNDFEGNIVLKPGKYDFYYKVAENIIYIGGEAYPEVIAYELDGGVLPAPAVPTNAELWEAFMPYYNTYYLANGKLAKERSPQPIEKVSTFAANYMQEIMTDPASEYKWLGDYVQSVATAAGLPLSTDMASANEGGWRWAVHAFFNAAAGQYGAAGMDFTEAGKPENWGAAYQAANELVLPTEPVAEDYVLPTPTKEGYKFVGWYDNAAGEGDAYEVISAGWYGTLYAIWEQDTTTALENIAVEGKAVKAIINGQLIIIKNGVQYNAQGQVVK